MDKDLKITLGVEEEFFLVDPNTRDLRCRPRPGHPRSLRKEQRIAQGSNGISPLPNRDQYQRLHINGRGTHSTDGDPPDSH